MSVSVPSINIPQIIQTLERRDLDDTAAPDAPPIWGQLENVPFVRVRGQAAFWKNEPDPQYEQRMDDLLASAYGQGLGFQYLIVGQPREYALFLGMEGPNAESILRASLLAAYPGITLSETVETSMGRILQSVGMFAHRGWLTGIPTRKGGGLVRPRVEGKRSLRPLGEMRSPMLAGHQIERILRGLAGEGWGLWIHATPYPLHKVVEEAYGCLDSIAAAASQTKRQLQQLNQTMQQVDPRTQHGSTESISGEIVNRQAEYAVMLLERNLQRLDEAKAVGMWTVEAHFFAPKLETLSRTQSLVRAVFAGPDSLPQALRVLPAGRTPLPISHFATRLTSTELGTLAQLPREEVPGYRLVDFARFDTDVDVTALEKAVPVGRILDGNRQTGQAFSLPFADFAKHGLIAGMTGSGKTTTLFGILDRLYHEGKIPFLVIEPAKAEYRRLRGGSGTDGKGTGPIPALRVYTLGDETVAPLRLNPFEFESNDPLHRIHVQTHIDYLKSVFNAAFILYAPMPYVLEICLHEVYTDRGWDLTTGLNRRLPASLSGEMAKWPVFPTLTDLYQKIDEVTERLGYEERIEMDVKAGLKARIGSLRLGSKGLMLDTQHGTPIDELLAYPTVLELERIGNDDEKAFIIGLIMTRVYELRRVQASQGLHSHFQHLIVLEEAHRLLKNISTEVETESANVRGQAVETFANMLAEIRAYGQGVFIAEQIPTKLTPDAVKNTNLKIIHRMVAADDRQVLAGTMNMDEEQERFLGTLSVGRAVVFSEQADHPYLLETEDFKKVRALENVPDQDIQLGMQPFTHRSFYEPVPDYRRYLSSTSGRSDTYLHDLAGTILNQKEFAELWAGLMLNLIRDPVRAKSVLEPLGLFVLATIGHIDPTTQEQVVKAVLLHASATSLYQRGRHLNWSYPVIEGMRRELVAGFMATVEGDAARAFPPLNAFVQQYRLESTRMEGPFPGCVPCQVRCWLRHDAAVAAQESALQRELVQAINQHSESALLWAELLAITRDATIRLTGPLPPKEVRAVAICIMAQAAYGLAFSRGMQQTLATKLSRAFEEGTL